MEKKNKKLIIKISNYSKKKIKNSKNQCYKKKKNL